jgi:hypothetical protein
VGADHADLHVDRPRPDGEHGGGVRQDDGHPTRAVVDPLTVEDLVPTDPQDAGDPPQDRLVDRARPDQWRRRECEAVGRPADPDQPGRTLLKDHVSRPRLPAGVEPGVAGPERRMPGERQLPGRREDPHPVIGGRVDRIEDERRLREVRPACEPLELGVVDPGPVEDDADRIAGERG